MVRMFIKDSGFNCDTPLYALSNQDDMPTNHPNFGLFEFHRQDQFCKWVDANNM